MPAQKRKANPNGDQKKTIKKNGGNDAGAPAPSEPVASQPVFIDEAQSSNPVASNATQNLPSDNDEECKMLVSDGSDCENETDGWLKEAQLSKWGQKVCFVTLSHTEKDSSQMPKDRKAFARMLNRAAMDIPHHTHCPGIPLKAVLAFREPHENGKNHYRAVLIGAKKSTAWKSLGAILLKMGVKVDARVVSAGPGTDPVHRILRYVLVPQPGKLQVPDPRVRTPTHHGTHTHIHSLSGRTNRRTPATTKSFSYAARSKWAPVVLKETQRAKQTRWTKALT